MMKIRFLIIVIVLMCSLMPDVSVLGQYVREEHETVLGDLGPDFIPPPKHYKTLETMLAEAGLAESSPGPPPIPLSGTREILVMLAELSDVTPDPTHTVAHFDDRFFDTAPPSVRDFYDENSYGAFTYVPGAVMGWYPSTHTQASYLANHYPVFVEAIQDVDTFFNFGPYDTDNNGLVENEELTLFMIVSGSLGGAVHSWDYPNIATADTNALGNPVSVEGEYSRTHENGPIGNYCHELGHDLGLPDLYDTNGGSEGIGNYGLMGGGSWTFSHMTAWSKIQLGWITPTVVTVGGYYDVHDAETNAEAYVLVDSAYSTDEYFLIENRHPANSYYETIGPPIAPGGTFPDEGIIIYHIDETKLQDWITSGTNNVNQDETHKMIDVETAEHPSSHFVNADDLDAEINRGDSDDLWDINEYDFNDTSTPCNANWYSGAPSGVKVSEFPAANHTMRVNITIPRAYDILIVDDNDGIGHEERGTSLPEFELALTDAGYDYVVWNESSMGNPPLIFLNKFKLVIWTCGDYWDWAVDTVDAGTLKSYLAQGGNILLEGESIGYNHDADDFMVNVAHATYQNYSTPVPGLTVTDPNHPVTLSLPTNFTWLNGEPPTWTDGASPTNGGAEVIQYTGTNTTAVTVFDGTETGYGSVVYYALPIYCLNQIERDKLIINSVNWLLVLRDILIVNDNDGSPYANGTSLSQFESALTSAGYDYMVWNESSMGNPPLKFLTKFKLVIWTCGDYYDWAVDPTDAETLESYLARGGNILLEGEDIGWNHKENGFMTNVAHAIFDVDNTEALGLTVTAPTHPVTQGLPTNFTWFTDPPFDDGVNTTNGGFEVIRYTNTSWTAVTVFNGTGTDYGSVVYYAFPIYCLNQIERDKLIINSVNWLLPRAPGDVNGDGSVDASDLSEFSKAYGSDPSKLNWNLYCDFNSDQKVDVSDLFDLGKNYGKTT